MYKFHTNFAFTYDVRTSATPGTAVLHPLTPHPPPIKIEPHRERVQCTFTSAAATTAHQCESNGPANSWLTIKGLHDTQLRLEKKTKKKHKFWETSDIKEKITGGIFLSSRHGGTLLATRPKSWWMHLGIWPLKLQIFTNNSQTPQF